MQIAVAVLLALMPWMSGTGLGEQIQQPLAVSVIGGFIAVLLLLLLCTAEFDEDIV